MRTLDEVATDLTWCAPWALALFERLLEEYRELLQHQPEPHHLAQLRAWQGQGPGGTGRQRQCYPPVALARPGLEAIVRQEVISRVGTLAHEWEKSGLTGLSQSVRHLLHQFEQQQPQRLALDSLPRLLRGLRRQGASIACQLRNWPWLLPASLSEIAYEIVAEGLRNACRHGDGSGRAALKIEVRQGQLRLQIRNPLGGPLRADGDGLGLKHLRWRVRSCRGSYRFLQVDQQARLKVRLPLEGLAPWPGMQ